MRREPLAARRRTVAATVLAAAAVLVAVVAGATSRQAHAGGAATPHRGGTLTLLGQSDIFNLDNTSAYYTVSSLLARAYTRQLFGYAASPSFLKSIQLQPDIASAVPTKGNGGISADGKTMTIHLKSGVKWNSSPPRDVTAGDFVRQYKYLCNPASPTAAPAYYTSTIVGMKAYCDGFTKVKATVAAINAYANGHKLAGVAAPNDRTLVFHLLHPTQDFLNIISMPFGSPRPVEYTKYVPDSAQFRQHTLANGPYEITKYTPTKGFELDRNPAWDPKTDTLRKAYVDKIKVTEGLTQDNVQQQLEAGTADMEWDVTPPAQDLPGLIAQKDNRLIIGPTGPYYVALGYYLTLNQWAGPMKNKLVRQAVQYAVDKTAVVQILGGPRITVPASQFVLPGSVGYIENYNPYPNQNGKGDAAKAKALLKKAGYPNGLAVKLIYQTTDPSPRIAQAIQASLKPAGFNVKLVPATQSDFYGKYMLNPDTAKRGVWDIGTPGWIPDWFGNNGRSVLQPLFTAPGPGASDFGGYNSQATNGLIDKALTAPSLAAASKYWQQAGKQIMADSAGVPINVQKWTVFHSSRVQGCVFWWWGLNCDMTNVWLS
jgi:peptide/nickel transport system substrate-binding protein